MTVKRVGLIGVGLMGHGIGKNVMAKGFSLNVMAHRNRAPVDSLIGLGAKEFKSPAEIAAASDMVNNSAAAEFRSCVASWVFITPPNIATRRGLSRTPVSQAAPAD